MTRSTLTLNRSFLPSCAVLLLSLSALAPLLPAHDGPASQWAAMVGNHYRITANITYKVANGYEAKLDVYAVRNSPKPRPTVVYIHGGGWTGGSKEGVALRLMPYLQLGMNVVNVEYRLARNSLAPAAVEDCRCALRWVIRNAERFGFDTSRLVVTGGSAGIFR